MDRILDFLCALILLSQNILTVAHTLTPSQSVSDSQNLTSQGGKFELGFFTPSSGSKNRYVGIWYKTIPVQTVVWVAIPIVKIDRTGNVVILYEKQSVVWSSNSSNVSKYPIIELLDSGNLVLRDAGNENLDGYLWQSFAYPGDTHLADMKLGWNLKTGINRYLSLWRKFDDPFHGDFTLGIELSRPPQLIMRKGSKKYYNGWCQSQNTGLMDLVENSLFTYKDIETVDEIYLIYQLLNQSNLVRFVMAQTGG